MIFDYQYRTHDNELKTGSISASSRDEAFRTLKARGVNPSRVELAPGIGNRFAALGKRGWTIILLVLLLGAVLAGAALHRGPFAAGGAPSAPNDMSDLDPEVLRRLENSGINSESINDLLEARRKVNEEYRRKIESEVKRGKLTRSAADELFRAMGL